MTKRPTVEPLEHRALLSNVLISTGHKIYEYDDVTGQLLDEVEVPGGDGRDLVVAPDGRIHVYVGSFGGQVSPPRINTYDPATGTWDEGLHYDGYWGAGGIGSSGNLGRWGKYLFAERNDGHRAHPLRFDLETGEVREFGPTKDAQGNVIEAFGSRDLIVAPSGLVYVLDSSYSGGLDTTGQTVHVFDPETLEKVQTIELLRPGPTLPIAGLSVRQDGHIFFGGMYHYDPAGNRLGEADRFAVPIGISQPYDADIRADGMMVVGTRSGEFLLTDEELVRYQLLLDLPYVSGANFVAFGTLAPQPVETVAKIVGRLFVDVNSDGEWQADENRLGRQTLFLDADADLVQDAEELTATWDDNSNYSFANVPAGKYTLCSASPTPWRIAAPVVVVKSGDYLRYNLPSEYVGAVISGKAFEDLNENGAADVDEPGLPGVRIFIDANADGVWQRREAYQFTDADGFYEFTRLSAGSYRLAQSEPAQGWLMSTPIASDVTLALRGASAQHFGSRDTLGDVAGNVFADVAADGLRNAGDYMVGGFRVFLDRNGDGWWNRSEIFTRTDELGRYTLSDVPAGLYWLRVTNIGGWRFTTNDALRVRVTPGGEVIRHFGVTRNLLILGNVFVDADASGGRDDAELGLRGWTVFADDDDDGVLDPDEISVRTDALGRYAIRTLAGGTHRVRVLQDPNYRRTAPAAGFRDVSLLPGAVVTRVNFGQERIASA